MKKLKIKDLQQIKERVQGTLNLREGKYRIKITVHMGTCGIASGARQVMSTLLELVEKGNYQDILLTSSGCAGLCSREPMVTIELRDGPPVKYADLNEKKIEEIFNEYVLEGKISKKYALAHGSEMSG
jgi:NADP-reducing hydrogenase subunit HndB